MAAIGVAGVGAAAGLISNSMRDNTTESSNMPEWTPEQRAILFDGAAWNPQMPQMTAEGMNYMRALQGGFNPMTGPQGPMDYQSLLGSIGNNGAGSGEAPKYPWFQDQNSSTFDQNYGGGVRDLLGYGAGTPPPTMTSSPYYSGQGVLDPQRLAAGHAMGMDLNYQPPQVNSSGAGLAPNQTQRPTTLEDMGMGQNGGLLGLGIGLY